MRQRFLAWLGKDNVLSMPTHQKKVLEKAYKAGYNEGVAVTKRRLMAHFNRDLSIKS